MESKKVSNASSLWWPNATLLQPSLLALSFKAPLRKFAHREHGFFSFLISKTTSFILVSTS